MVKRSDRLDQDWAAMMDRWLGSRGKAVRSGKLRPLGVTTPARIAVLPDVPTIAEFVPGYEAGGWNGIGAPKGTPTDVIAMLNSMINAVVADPKVRAHFDDLGFEPISMSPNEFGKHRGRNREVGQGD